MGLLLLDDGRERTRGRQRVHVRPRGIVQVDRAVAAHGQAGAQRFFGAVGTETHGDDFTLPALLLDAQRFLDGELVVGRDDPGDAGGVDGLAARADLDLRRRVRHLLDGHENLHSGSLL